MSYTLIVVDVQPRFSAAKKVKKACIKEINKAIDNKAHIVFLEFVEYGDTYQELIDVLKEKQYKKFGIGFKEEDDGSDQVKEIITKKRMIKSKFKVVGVNTGYCVLATVEGLAEKYPKANIEVLSKACNSAFYHKTELGWIEHNKHLLNVKVL
jgi:nicotinamidase-related amidase